MPGQWIFRELRRGDKDRQPTQGEFFATDAIRSVAEALVRETIQNSLDARVRTSDSPVRVRFHLANGATALPADTARKYFEGGWKHFTAEGNGLDDVPNKKEPCSFLVIEDFGTTGLIGDVRQWRHVPDIKNPFYYFFRTEGRSGKGEEDRGRWGIGKYVFPRSSRINAFVALTVRSDDAKRLLMGQAVLKSHVVGSKYFTPDGDYGKDAVKGWVLPVSEGKFLDQFSKDFMLARKNEPGLSVMVPWVDEEITHEALLTAVIEDYFFPILCGDLIVTVSSSGQEAVVSEDTLEDACHQIGGDFEQKMLPLMSLALWSREQSATTMVRLASAPAQRPKWEPGLIPNDHLLDLRARFRSGQKLAVEVPLTVREQGHPPRESYFRMFLVNDGAEDGSPVFIRDGIIISDVRGRWVPSVRSLVVIDHPPLAKLLGDSENPAHTQWQKDREHFRHKYTYGKSYIDFVTHGVSMFVRYLNESDEQPDRDLLRDIFFVPKPPESEEPREKSKPRKRNKGEVIQPDPKVEPKRRRFTLSKVAGGFSITRGENDALTPAALEIAMAYDRRRGSPLKRYSAADFKIDETPLDVTVQGATITQRYLNRLTVTIVEREFRVSVTGFDENRDLFVDVKTKEMNNDSEA